MKDYLKITFCGDIMCLRDQNKAAMAKYGDYSYEGYLSSISHLFKDSDYVIANLETPLLPPPFFEKDTTQHDVRFSTPASILDEVKSSGINFVSTANNHCLDRGLEGIKDTIVLLDEYGIDHSGTFCKRQDDYYFTKELEGIKIAIVCSTYGTNSRLNGTFISDDENWMINLTRRQEKLLKLKFEPSDREHSIEKYIPDDVSPAAISNSRNQILLNAIADNIRKAKESADIVIAFPHVGGQYNPAPGLYTKHVVQTLNEAGADIIVANHPHTSHRCERLSDGTFCAWALGNLAFTPETGFFLPNTLSDFSIILHTYWNKKTLKLDKITFNVTKCVTWEDLFTRVIEVSELCESISNKTERERLIIDNEAVVNRFAGWARSIIPQKEYELFSRKI